MPNTDQSCTPPGTTYAPNYCAVGTLRVTAKGIKTSGCSRAWGLNALTEECTHLKIEGQPDVALNPEPQT